MGKNNIKNPIIVALDTDSLKSMWEILNYIGDLVDHVKIGPRIFALGGINLLEELSKKWNVFLDLKLHDIPNTVKLAVEVFAKANIWALTLHSAGGKKMLEEAHNTKVKVKSNIKLFGVTLLTSLSEKDFKEVSPGSDLKQVIIKRAMLCLETKMDGIICSPKDLQLLPKEIHENLLKITPGIRLFDGKNDQVRVTTPFEAIKLGADYIVVGRSITKAKDPKKAVTEILRQIKEAKESGDQR